MILDSCHGLKHNKFSTRQEIDFVISYVVVHMYTCALHVQFLHSCLLPGTYTSSHFVSSENYALSDTIAAEARIVSGLFYFRCQNKTTFGMCCRQDGAAKDHIRCEMRTKYYVAPRVSTFTFTFWNDANCSPLPSQATPPPLIRTALRNKKVHQDYKRSVVR